MLGGNLFTSANQLVRQVVRGRAANGITGQARVKFSISEALFFCSMVDGNMGDVGRSGRALSSAGHAVRIHQASPT